MRRFLSVLLATLMLVNIGTTVFAEDLRSVEDLQSYAKLYRELRDEGILGEDSPFLYWVMMTELSKALEKNDLVYSNEWGFLPPESIYLFVLHQCMVDMFFPDCLLIN